jgi:hypothetical protein
MWGSRFAHDVPMDHVNAMHPQIILAILRAAYAIALVSFQNSWLAFQTLRNR